MDDLAVIAWSAHRLRRAPAAGAGTVAETKKTAR
jgi:hypothetical protein